MAIDIVHWPANLLCPASATVASVPFTRSGGRSLGGIERVARTDNGFWRIQYDDVTLFSPAMRRTWDAIAGELGGRAGLVAVPVWAFDSAPYASGNREPIEIVPHGDGTTFSDGSGYSQGAIDIQMETAVGIGATVATIRLIHASQASGIKFSYQHALYRTGRIINQLSDTVFEVRIFPAIRAPIPAGSQLEADLPTCLCRLATDNAMDISLTNAEIDSASLAFVEAVDIWNMLALGEVI